MKIIKNLLFLWTLLAFVPPLYAQSTQAPTLLVVVLGDELTGNSYLSKDKTFSAQLEKKLRDIGFPVQVVDVSLIETSSTEFVQRINNIMAKSPDVVIVQIGETDIKRGLDPNMLLYNLTFIVETLKQGNVYPIVMGSKAPENRGADYAEQIRAVFEKISKKAQIYPETLYGIDRKPELTIGDGYRPNASGVALMVENVYRYVDAGLRWRIEVIKSLARQKQQQLQQLGQ